MQDYIGHTIERYLIKEQLGQGGMAVVYKAFDTRLEREVALKLIQTDEIPPIQLDPLLKRFEREAKSQARLSHPSIVPVHDYGSFEGMPYLVMEYLHNGTLRDLLKGPIPLKAIIAVISPLALGLAYAHNLGVIHRDIKPSNILFNQHRRPMLTDFGIAKLMEADQFTLTGTGLGVGTPEYMAPEQWKGEAVPQTDIYALGVIMYEMLTGVKPYTAETPLAVALKQMTEPFPRPNDLVEGVPAEVEMFLFKALARNPEQRQTNMQIFHEELIKLRYLFTSSLPSQQNKPKPVEEIKQKEPEKKVKIKNEKVGQKEKDEIAWEDLLEEDPTSNGELQSKEISPVKIISEPKPIKPKTKGIKAHPPKPLKGKRRVSTKNLILGLLLVLGVAGGVFGLSKFKMPKPEIIAPTEIIKATAEIDLETVTNTQKPTLTITPNNSKTNTPTQVSTNTQVPTNTPPPSATLTSTSIYKIGSTLIREKDGMEMVYVPAGEFVMGTSKEQIDWIEDNNWCDYCEQNYFINENANQNVYLDAYWIDKFEITVSQFAEFLNQNRIQNNESEEWFDQYQLAYRSGSYTDVSLLRYSEDGWKVVIGYEMYPATAVSAFGAQAYCEWVGGKLPTEAQWEKAARGTDGRMFPWGNEPPAGQYANFANFNGGIKEIGQHPAGASPYGALDMAGNVSEWVTDWVDTRGSFEAIMQLAMIEPYINPVQVNRGGDYINKPFLLLATTRNYKNSYESGTGFRCVYYDQKNQGQINAQIPAASPTPIYSDSYLRQKDGMEMVFVPEGEFIMGNDVVYGGFSEWPAHPVYLNAYWIDKLEVTNKQFSQCVADNKCVKPYSSSSLTRYSYYDNPEYADFPVIYVDHSQALSYCKWVGGRLPTEAEWEKAARGTDQRVYPWGNTPLNHQLANYVEYNVEGDTVRVGSFPGGASPYGALDMAGNVWEWVSDWYNEKYYKTSPPSNPQGPFSGTLRIVRGGSVNKFGNDLRTTARQVYPSTRAINMSIGFRCVMDELP